MKSSTKRLAYKPRRAVTISAKGITFVIALLIVAAIIGLVILTWNLKSDQPPILSISRSAEIREVQGQFYVPFTIRNTGGETAESVQIIGELRQNGEIVESGDQQVDFLSGGETEEGAFVFTRDPEQADLTIRVASYKLP